MWRSAFNVKLFTLFLLRLSTLLTALMLIALALGRALPAGERFSFAEKRGVNSDIYALDLSRSLLVDLTRSPGNDVDEAWSPDGTRMAFISDRSGAFQLYLMTLDGGGVHLLDAHAISPNYRPVWSSNGRSLVYDVMATNGDDIAVVAVDQPLVAGSNPRVLAPSPTDDRYPVWSPDGTHIAFTSWRNGSCEIFLVRPDGSDLTDLSSDPDGNDVSPAWSPDGQQIAFFSIRSQFRELYVMNVDGSHVRQLTDARQPRDGSYWGAPVWSPDGQSIAYQTEIGNLPSVVVIDLNGSVQRQLINGQQARPLFGGKRLTYLAISNERTLLYLTEADGSSPRALTPVDANANLFSNLFAR